MSAIKLRCGNVGTSVVAGSKATPVFEFCAKTFDQTVLFIERLTKAIAGRCIAEAQAIAIPKTIPRRTLRPLARVTPLSLWKSRLIRSFGV